MEYMLIYLVKDYVLDIGDKWQQKISRFVMSECENEAEADEEAKAYASHLLKQRIKSTLARLGGCFFVHCVQKENIKITDILLDICTLM